MSLRTLLGKIFIDLEFKKQILFLQHVPLFNGLSDRVLAKIISISNYKTYQSGEIVFDEGSVGRILYVIRSGEVEGTKGGKSLFVLRKGDFFGEMALLEETTRSVTVRAVKPAELMLIYKVKFDGLLDDDPRTGIKMLLNLSRRLSTRLRDATSPAN